MTDFFADLENELRRAHRRDIAQPRRIPLPSLRPLLTAAAAIGAVVAVVAIAVGMGRDNERVATPAPPPAPAPACDIYEPPIVDEPMPEEIRGRFELFRSGQTAQTVPLGHGLFTRAARLYEPAVVLRAADDHGPGPIVGVAIAADVAPPPGEPNRDDCSPPRGQARPGVCLAADAPGRDKVGGCFELEAVEDADAWIEIDTRGVLGIAPDGPTRVIFDTGQPNGPESLTVADNAYGGWRLYLHPARTPYEAETRF